MSKCEKKSLEEIFRKRIETEFGKEKLLCGTLGDLEKIGKKFEICNLYDLKEVVRKIEIDKKLEIINRH